MSNQKNNLIIKSVLHDIIRGYSVTPNKLYIKHADLFDSSKTDEYANELWQKAESNGLFSLKERLEQVRLDELWTDTDEKELNDEKLFCQNLLITRQKLHSKEDRENIDEQLKPSQKKISDLEDKKKLAIGPTIESFVDNRSKEIAIINSFYKDSSFKKPFFKNIKDIFNENLKELVLLYIDKMSVFTASNMKKASLSQNFLPAFCMCDNDPYKFYGIPIINLTFFQIDLFSFAAKYKRIFSEAKNIPDELLDDPEKLEEWYERYENTKKLVEKNKGGKHNNMLVSGVSEDELDAFGLKNQMAQTDKLIREAQKRGGSLSLEDAIKSDLIN